MNQQENKRIWIVRHGMRIDFATPSWTESAENPYNPPLAPEGLLQARETAVRFEREDLDAIFVSPFLRTLQTARFIAEKKGLPLLVEPGFSEFLKEEEFTHSPVESDLEQLRRDFPEIDPTHGSALSPRYPESVQELDRRIDSALDSIINSSLRNILIVSHGSPIKSIYRYFTGAVPGTYQPMSSVTMFDFCEGSWNLAIDGDSSHLSIADTTGKAFYAELEKNRRP